MGTLVKSTTMALSNTFFWDNPNSFALLTSETQGLSIDARGLGGFVSVKDTTTTANNRTNVRFDASLLLQTGTSPKYVIADSGNLLLIPVGQIAQEFDRTYAYGMLIEPAATNLTNFSEQFDNAYWLKSDVTITPDNLTAPNGTVTADQAAEGVINSASLETNVAFTIVSGGTYTFSCFLKKGNTDWMTVRAYDPNSGGATQLRAWFNLTTGAAGSVANLGAATGATGVIIPLGNGWYRCILTGALNNAAVTGKMFTCSAQADASNNRVNNAVYNIWGSQAEAGTIATSYTPTIATSVTRAADIIRIPTTRFPWSDSTGTIYLDYKPKLVTGTNYGWSAFKDVNNFISYAGINTTPNQGNIQGGTTDVANNLGTLVANTRTQISCAFQTNEFDGSQDGAALVTDSVNTLTTGYTNLYIGTNGVTGNELNGYIYRMVYVPRQVQAASGNLTTWRYNF